MLKSWTIKNFKAIVDSGELQLAPVTILAGRNSSGKSSLLQSILMVAQTLSSRLLDRPLLPNDRIVQLGTFEDILNEWIGLKKLTLGFELIINESHKQSPEMEVNIAKVMVNFSGESTAKTSLSAIEALKPVVESMMLEVRSTIQSTHYDIEGESYLVDDNIYAQLKIQKISSSEFENILNNIETASLRLVPYTNDQSTYLGKISFSPYKEVDKPYLVALSHFLPTRFIERIKVRELQRQHINRIVDSNFMPSPLSVLQQRTNTFTKDLSLFSDIKDFDINIIDKPALRAINLICQKEKIVEEFRGKSIEDLGSWFRSIKISSLADKRFKIEQDIKKILVQSMLKNIPVSNPDLESLQPLSQFTDLNTESLSQTVEHITRFFTSKIRYLGPLRAEPQASQKFAPSSELDDVGPRGEYAAAVYDASQNIRISWYNPTTLQVEKAPLKVALDSWARYLGVANQIQIETAGQSGFSWQIIHREGHKPLPLAAVGVGVSQILPILVMGLLSPAGSLLIIEQPELHLHPAVQARLGDFFMGLAKCNKQCLIETHSENLVSQLRYHIVQAGGQEQSDCMIYFVDQDEQGAAKFEQVQISPQGNILNWPNGFFDETMLQEDRITAASIKKRAKSAKNVVKNGQ